MQPRVLPPRQRAVRFWRSSGEIGAAAAPTSIAADPGTVITATARMGAGWPWRASLGRFGGIRRAILYQYRMSHKPDYGTYGAESPLIGRNLFAVFSRARDRKPRFREITPLLHDNDRFA